MNIGNLELKEYKNKNELCEVLGVKKATGGRNMKLQDDEFARYFNYEKHGHKIIITEVYNEPKEKVDGRGKNGHHKHSHKHSTSDYKDLQYVLLDYLLKNKKEDVIYITNNLLATKLITSQNYYFCMKNEEYFNIYTKNIKVLENSIVTKNLFSNVNSNIKGIISTVMKNLNKNYGLIYEYDYVINCFYEDENTKNIMQITRRATKEEVKVINSTLETFIQKFNIKHAKTLTKRKNIKTIKNLNDSYSLKPGMFKEFWDDLNTDIYDALYEKFDIDTQLCYKAYTIHHHTLDLDNVKKVIEGIQVGTIQSKLKEKFVKNCIKSVQKKIDEMDEYIQDRIKKMDIWGEINEDTIDKLIRNKFADSKVILHKEFYLRNYTDILNLLILNKNTTNIEIKDLFGNISAIKSKIEEKRSKKK